MSNYSGAGPTLIRYRRPQVPRNLDAASPRQKLPPIPSKGLKSPIPRH